MPHPSNINRTSGRSVVTNPTVYLLDWHRQLDPGINGTQTQPVLSGDPVVILELISGSWRKIANPENFVDVLGGEGIGNLNGRTAAINRLCDKIWVGTRTGRLFNSFDAGKTWELNASEETTGTDFVNFTDYDVSGRLWRNHDNIGIYRSDSGNGDDWELLYDFEANGLIVFTSAGGAFPAGRGIACHPTNKNIVAIPIVDIDDLSSPGFSVAKCLITTDGGNSFYIVTLPVQSYIEFPPEPFGIYDVIFTDTGRLIIVFENFENEEPFENRYLASYSDDYENFVLTELLPEVRTGHAGFQSHLETYENLVWAIFTRDHDAGFSPVNLDALIVHLAISTDNGETYTELTRFININNGLSVEFPAYPQGIIYDPASQLLYCFFTILSFDIEGLPVAGELSLQTVDNNGNKAIATNLMTETGFEIPYPLQICATHRKRFNSGSSSSGENVPKGFTRGNPSNLPASIISSCG